MLIYRMLEALLCDAQDHEKWGDCCITCGVMHLMVVIEQVGEACKVAIAALCIPEAWMSIAIAHLDNMPRG